MRGFATRGEANTPSVSECREVPAEAGEAVEEAELEEVADAAAGESAEITQGKQE